MSNIDEEIKKKNEEIQKNVAAKIKSKAFKVTSTFGAQTLFDIKAHSDLDYTAGGQLSPRFVKDSDESISRRRVQGYVLPQEVDPNLKNISFGGLTVMLRTAEAAQNYREYIAKENDKVSGEVMERSETVKEHKGKFVDFESKSTKKAITAYKA